VLPPPPNGRPYLKGVWLEPELFGGNYEGDLFLDRNALRVGRVSGATLLEIVKDAAPWIEAMKPRRFGHQFGLVGGLVQGGCRTTSAGD
jgi:hypothetical protein